MNSSVPPEISVIMPAYNSETLIRRSLDCLLSQTFADFEVIIVDDGSTDGTGDICDKYEIADKRIRVFHKPNGGVASARQFGIERARGKYSIHFDADDIATEDMLTELYITAVANDADVVISDFFEKMPDGTVRYVSQDFVKSYSSDILIEILERRLFGALWHKLIRTSLFEQKGISFVPGLNYCEDVLVEARMFKDDDVRIVHHPNAYYTYCHDNPNSITVNYTAEKLKLRIAFLNQLKTVLDKHKFNHAFESTVWDVKMEAYTHGILQFENFHTVYRSSIFYLAHVNLSRRQRLKLIVNELLFLFPKSN